MQRNIIHLQQNSFSIKIVGSKSLKWMYKNDYSMNVHHRSEKTIKKLYNIIWNEKHERTQSLVYLYIPYNCKNLISAIDI